jgi:hypothetical protein
MRDRMITHLNRNPHQDPDAEFRGWKCLVTLPKLSPQISHARVAWCEERLGKPWGGAWNYYDFHTEYVFHNEADAVAFALTWS